MVAPHHVSARGSSPTGRGTWSRSRTVGVRLPGTAHVHACLSSSTGPSARLVNGRPGFDSQERLVPAPRPVAAADAPVAQRKRQRVQGAFSPGSNPGRGTTPDPGWCNWQHDGLWIRRPRFEPWTGSRPATGDARWSSRHGRRVLTAETEVGTLGGRQRPCGETADARGSNPCAREGLQVRLLLGAHHDVEGWPSQARHWIANPRSGTPRSGARSNRAPSALHHRGDDGSSGALMKRLAQVRLWYLDRHSSPDSRCCARRIGRVW